MSALLEGDVSPAPPELFTAQRRPLIRGSAVTGERVAFRLDGSSTGLTSAFVTDWSVTGSFSTTFLLRDAWESLADLYGAPPPAPESSWARLASVVAGGVEVNRNTDGTPDTLAIPYTHGHRVVPLKIGRAHV